MIEQTADEENKSKEVLDNKLELEQQLMDLQQKVMKDSTLKANNREELLKMKVKNSQLDSQNKMLDIEQEQLTEGNAKRIAENLELEKENQELKKQIAMRIQQIDINNLLKEIDTEEL